MTDIKLLTEAEVRGYFKHNPCAVDAIIESFRERGLIAEEPVDPLLVEAREVVAKWAEGIEGFGPYADDYRSGKRDKDSEIQTCIAALRRGMELQRDKLTREVVREAADAATIDHFLRAKGIDHPDALDMRLKRLHAALLERLS